MGEPIVGEVRPLKAAEEGVFMTTVTWGVNLAEKGMAAPLGLGRTIRDELFRATYAGVDFVEGANQSMFKVVRDLIQRMDKLSLEALQGAESLAGAVSRAIRGSGEAAGEVVSRTAASVVGTKESPTKAA